MSPADLKVSATTTIQQHKAWSRAFQVGGRTVGSCSSCHLFGGKDLDFWTWNTCSNLQRCFHSNSISLEADGIVPANITTSPPKVDRLSWGVLVPALDAFSSRRNHPRISRPSARLDSASAFPAPPASTRSASPRQGANMKLTMILPGHVVAGVAGRPTTLAADYPAPKEGSWVGARLPLPHRRGAARAAPALHDRRRAHRRAGADPARHRPARAPACSTPAFARRAVRPGPAARREPLLHHPSRRDRHRQVEQALRRPAREVPALQLRRHGRWRSTGW